MTHDEMMSLLANTLADAAGHAGCLPVLDCFSPHPGEDVTVSIPMCDDTVDIVLEDLDFPHEWEELLENSGADNYIVKELRAPLGYYVNEEPMEVTFTYDGQAIMVLDNTCANKPTEMWVSKRDLTNDEELPGVTLAIKDMDGNTVTTWVSTDEPHRVTGLHFGESYTLTEIRAADGYALANDITFRLIQKSDEDGNPLEECEVYYLTTKNILFWKWDDWKLLDDATVIMQDDITKVQISKKDLTTNEELPGAELVIKDKDGTEIDRWISTNEPHYVEKMPARTHRHLPPTTRRPRTILRSPRRTRPQRRHPCPLHPLQHVHHSRLFPKPATTPPWGCCWRLRESLLQGWPFWSTRAPAAKILRPVTMTTRTPRTKE